MEYIILIVSLVGIVFGADFLVAGAVSIARKFKVSDFVIGAAIVGVGTSMPELVVSFIGAVNGNADVAIGNVVGSNIFNVLGILGLTAVLFPVAVDRKNMRFEIPLCIGVSVLLTLLVFNFFNGSTTTIGRVDGLVLLFLFAFFMWYSFRRDRKEAPTEESSQEDGTPLWKAILKVVGGLALLITSCDFFVDNDPTKYVSTRKPVAPPVTKAPVAPQPPVEEPQLNFFQQISAWLVELLNKFLAIFKK